MSEIDPGDRGAGNLPGDGLLTYARSLLRRSFRIPVADLDDVLGDALLEFLRAGRETLANPDGFFLVIARRRAIDYRRSLKARRLPSEHAGFQEPDTEHLEVDLIERWVSRRVCRADRASRTRLNSIVHEILAGKPFSEACEASQVPRGSQSRYREALKRYLGPLKRSLSSPASS